MSVNYRECLNGLRGHEKRTPSLYAFTTQSDRPALNGDRNLVRARLPSKYLGAEHPIPFRLPSGCFVLLLISIVL